MKKPSKQWLEFSQIIGILDIRISRKQRELLKLKKELTEIEERATAIFEKVTETREALKALRPAEEANSIDIYFHRSDYYKSTIENHLIDYSFLKEQAEKVQQSMQKANKEKFKLEKRKDALKEVQSVL